MGGLAVIIFIENSVALRSQALQRSPHHLDLAAGKQDLLPRRAF